MSVAVWLKPPDPASVWTAIGETGNPRVVPGSVHLEADEFGPSTGSFVVNIDGRQPVPALTPYSKCRVEIDGMRVWSGFVQTAPRTGRQIAVSLQGSQMFTDDPLVTLTPVDNRFSQWDDTPCVEGQWDTSGGQRSTGAGGMTFSWSQASTFPFACYSAFTYKGAPKSVTAIAVLAGFSATVPGLSLVAQDYTTTVFQPFPGAVDSAAYFSSPATTGWQFLNGTIAQPARYVAIGLYGAAGVVVPDGFTVTIYMLTVYERVSYSSGGLSNLTGSVIAKRVAGLLPDLSADQSQLQPSAFQTPAYYSDGPKSPRDILKAAAGLDDTLLKIDALDRLVFKPRPSSPTIELGATSPTTQETPFDPSTLASSVLVTMQDANNNPIQQRVTILDLPETPRQLAPVTFPNPSFAGGSASGWTVAPLSGTTTTLTVSSAHPPPGMSFGYAEWNTVPANGPTGYVWTVLSGGLKVGVPYALRFWAFNFANPPASFPGSSFVATLTLWLYDGANPTSFHEFRAPLASSLSLPHPWQMYEFSFVPEEPWTAPTVAFYAFDTDNSAYPNGWLPVSPAAPVFGNFSLWTAAGPLAGVSRAGSQQMPAGPNQGWAKAVGQVYLRSFNRLGYTATRDVADRQARDGTTGVPLPAACLLGHTSEPARLADRIDPMTGAQGAQGHISQVAYDHESRRAAVTVGQRYSSVDEWVARSTAFAPPA